MSGVASRLPALEAWSTRPTGPLRARLRVPGDKSITHRALILAALANGTNEIEGALASDDCRATAAALAALGAEVAWHAGGVRVTGRPLRAPTSTLDLGNSGTGLRLLAGVLAAQAFTATLTGDASLRRRPMARVAEPLERMGARVATTHGCAPLTITGAGDALRPVDYLLPVASAQVKSAILLAALFARGETVVREPLRSRDHTERLLPAMGVAVRRDADAIRLTGPARPRAARLRVPGDFSSAAFFLVAAAARPGALIEIEGVGLNPTRTGLIEILRAMGARIEVGNLREEAGEPVGDLRVEGAALRGTDVDPALVPRAIDDLPALFVAAAVARGHTRVRGAAELRVKESDRLATMAAGLRALGATVREHADGLEIEGGGLHGGVVDGAGDHRVAMAFAVAGQLADGPVRILDTANVATSYPGFAEAARAAGFDLDVDEEAGRP
jgi:3-phosphoshikimate 1-carboxyvinyltransferase